MAATEITPLFLLPDILETASKRRPIPTQQKIIRKRQERN